MEAKVIPPIHESLVAKKDLVCYDPKFEDEDLSELWSMYSDCYKDKYGIRPRSAMDTAMTVQEVWNALNDGHLDYVPGEDD